MRTQPPPAPFSGPGFRVPNEGMTEGWFLGPHAENADTLKELVAYAIDQHCEYRREFHPEDPAIVTDAIRSLPIFQRQLETLKLETSELCKKLQFSAPIFSLRHQGHMLWDQAMPAIIGYVAAMLYDQNNVAAEASPVTTRLEIEVGDELCRMLGFDTSGKSVTPWGHITCDGSVANIESLWTARNIKFFPIALAAALREEPVMSAASALQVTKLDGSSATLISLDAWALLNLKIDDVVTLPETIEANFGIKVGVTAQALQKYALPNIGWIAFYNQIMSAGAKAPVVIAPATAHYSWPKAGTLLGLGQNAIVRVPVDLDARMRVDELDKELARALVDRVPVVSVIAVIGSTEESAVDPLRPILDLREKYRTQGLDFAVHADAAWGGYFASMLRDPQDHTFSWVPSAPMSVYVRDQYKALGLVDSITVDPHKAGYVPYPAGGLCYRNSAMRNFVSLKAPVVFHGQSDPTVGVYGVEGSKPGAAAAAVYLAHRVIPLTRDGYGKILSQCFWTSKRLYCRLVTMKDDRFTLTLVQRLPAERDGESAADIQRQRDHIRDVFVPKSNRELDAYFRANTAERDLFYELGSDQVILTYAFNFIKDGTLNTDIDAMNELNDAVFDICSMLNPPASWPELNKKELILTSSSFDPAVYGQAFVDEFALRAGCAPVAGKTIDTLISTTMNPWTTDTPQGDFLAVIEQAFRDVVHQALDGLE